jgi:PAS domain S-box-containing protein
MAFRYIKNPEERLKFAAILADNIADAVIGTEVSDNTYRIVSWNRGAENLYGWKSEEVIGKNTADVIPSSMSAEEREKMIIGLRVKGSWEGEVIQHNKNGRPIHIHAVVATVKDDEGKEIGVVAVNRDISERKKTDERLRQSEEKYRQLSATLDDKVKKRTEQLNELNAVLAENNQKLAKATEELELKNLQLQKQMDELRKLSEWDVQKNNFIAMASHELKTPITSIKGYVQLLLHAMEKEKNEEKPLPPLLVKSSLKSVDKQISRLTRLISELLDLSKIETGTLELKKENFILNELAIETVEDILYTTPSHEIILFHDFHCQVFADKDRIGQVMINFLTNAIKYSPDNKRINVRIHRLDNEIAFSVEDFGIGIDEHEQSRVFERFYRARGRQEQTYPGFGIGLFIANEFIQKHGGRLLVESEKGKGSVFTFTLPIV